MGRAEIRARSRKASLGKDVIVLTKDELKQIKKDAVDEICKMDVEALLTCFAQVLHDNYGWGHVRVTRALKAVDEEFGKVLRKESSLEKMKQRLSDEVGINILC